MAFSALLIEGFKLDVEFGEGYVEHAPLGTSRSRGSPKLIWTRNKMLGEGGFGQVWLEHESDGSLRAVKEVSKYATGRISLDYQKELAALARLSQHDEHFVQFLGWYENEQTVFFAMEYFPLGDLEKCFIVPLGEESAKAITTQLLEGLEVMHAHGFTHRDLKPQNIFVVSMTPKWRVKIGDFGISKRILQNETAMSTAIGSVGYLAPEVLGCIEKGTGATYTNAVDIWSLGCIVYWMLTSKIPFADLRALFHFTTGLSNFPSGPLSERGISMTGKQFVLSLMALQPQNRLQAKTALRHPWLNAYLIINEPQVERGVKLPRYITTGMPINKANSRGGAIAFKPDNSNIIAFSQGAKVLLWDLVARTYHHSINDHGGSVNALEFSKDGQLIATASSDKTAQISDAVKGTRIHTLKGHTEALTDVAFSPDGRTIATSSRDRTVRIWDINSGQELREIRPGGEVHGIAFSPDGNTLVSVADDLRAWDPATGTFRNRFEMYERRFDLSEVTFSPDGQVIAIIGRENSEFLIYNVTGAIRHTLNHLSYDYNKCISAVTFSPDGRLLATATDRDETVRLWDPITGAKRCTLQGHSKYAEGLAFSHDGKYLAAAEDGSVRLWDLRGKDEPRIPRPILGLYVAVVLFVWLLFSEPWRTLTCIGISIWLISYYNKNISDRNYVTM